MSTAKDRVDRGYTGLLAFVDSDNASLVHRPGIVRRMLLFVIIELKDHNTLCVSQLHRDDWSSRAKKWILLLFRREVVCRVLLVLRDLHKANGGEFRFASQRSPPLTHSECSKFRTSFHLQRS